MRAYDAEELRDTFNFELLIGALEDGHRRDRPELLDGIIGGTGNRYMTRSVHGGNLIGSKLITIRPDNPGLRSIPSVHAVIVLFDADSGQPRAVLDATELTYWKTAADSALGSKLLSRKDARTLAIAGAGGLSSWLVRGHCAARPSIERVLIWNRTPERARLLADRLNGEGISAGVVSQFEDAVRKADIVATATMAQEPVLEGEWLKPGTHVDLVGSYSPDTREADDEVLRRGRLFVDCRESALAGVGDIEAPLKAGILTEDDILGDLFDLAQSPAPARRDEDEITVFKNAGGAHLDLMVAEALVRKIEMAAK